MDLDTAIYVEVGQDVQELINANGPGTTYVLRAGIHRLQTLTPKTGDTFVGEEGAILSGAIVLEGFSREGDLWTIGGQSQNGTVSERIAYNGQDLCHQPTTGRETPRCNRPETLFMDGELLRHADSLNDVTEDAWFFDYDGDKIYVGRDPSGVLVETSVTPQAIVALGSGSVRLWNLVIEKYASPMTVAAVQTANGWLVEGGAIRHNAGVGIRLNSGSVMRGTRVHHNGQLGVSANGDGVLIENVEIDHNNVGGFSSFQIGGGTKFTRTQNLVVRDSYVHDNLGAGLSADFDNIFVHYENNRIVGNTGPGIHHEASYDAVFHNNWVENNGHGRRSWVLGAGIFVNSSANVTITNNTLLNNYQGVIAVQVPRSDGTNGGYGEHVLENVKVIENSIFMARGQSGLAVAGEIEAPERFYDRITFIGNTYRLGDQPYPFRLGSDMAVNDWISLGQDIGGTFERLP